MRTSQLLALLLAIPAAVGCSAAQNDDGAESLEQDIYGYLGGDPGSWNTRVLKTITYGQKVTSLACMNPSDRHPAAMQYQPTVKYCAVKLHADRFDKISASVFNTDSWATDEIQAYLVDDEYHVIDKARFEGDHNGNNKNKPVQLDLSGGKQVGKSGTYYVVFTKFAIRDGGTTTYADDFSVQLNGTHNADLPIALDKPPVRSGIYTSPKGDFMVDVVPPAPGAEKDFGAWRAHVYAKTEGCGTAKSLADFSKIDCNDTSCWFYETKKDFGGGSSASGNWYLRGSGAKVDYAFLGQVPTTLQLSRETSDMEREAYESPTGCRITCPPAPPPPPHYSNPCAGGGAPGWCFQGWVPPHGFESPLVLNLAAGNTITFTGKPVSFDLDGHGAQPQDWVAPAFPFLALDLSGNGIIDNGTELFGTATVLTATSTPAPDGFSALAQYDDNADGKIDTKDAIYRRLLLWTDKNSDGVSDAGRAVAPDVQRRRRHQPEGAGTAHAHHAGRLHHVHLDVRGARVQPVGIDVHRRRVVPDLEVKGGRRARLTPSGPRAP